jgi:ribosomal protein S18 acetylase RimI-like enzyme
MTLAFRPFQPSDADRLQQIRQAAFTPIHEGFRQALGEEVYQIDYADWNKTQGDYLRSFIEGGEGKALWVALDGEDIVGFICCTINPERRTGILDLNAIDPAFQKRGAGTAMYRFAMDQLKQRGARVVSVSTGGDAAHAAARRAYEKAGFDRTVPSVYYVTLV